MLVTYGEYVDMGFCSVSEEAFARLRARAEAVVNRYTFGRATRESLTRAGKYAVCEIIDVFNAEESGGELASFSNEGYQESYRQGLSAAKKAEQILYTFFDREMVFRGVRKYRGEEQ